MARADSNKGFLRTGRLCKCFLNEAHGKGAKVKNTWRYLENVFQKSECSVVDKCKEKMPQRFNSFTKGEMGRLLWFLCQAWAIKEDSRMVRGGRAESSGLWETWPLY